MTSKLLFDSQPLIIIPELAVIIGLNESIVLQQIHYWTQTNRKLKQNHIDGHTWTYNSYTNWQFQFPFWCIRTIKSIFTKLEHKKLLISANYNKLKIDRTKWYRINYIKLDELVENLSPARWGKSCTMDSANFALPLPEILRPGKPQRKKPAKTLIHIFSTTTENNNSPIFKKALK